MLYSTSPLVLCTLDALPVNRRDDALNIALERSLEQSDRRLHNLLSLSASGCTQERSALLLRTLFGHCRRKPMCETQR